MNSRFRKLAVESLEGRSVLSTMVQADFNHDGRDDVAAITDPNTITVSLFNPASGGFDVSDILSSPNNQPIQNIGVWDQEGDGDWDIYATGLKRSGSGYVVMWVNNGDGTFDYIEPVRWKHSKWFV